MGLQHATIVTENNIHTYTHFECMCVLKSRAAESKSLFPTPDKTSSFEDGKIRKIKKKINNENIFVYKNCLTFWEFAIGYRSFVHECCKLNYKKGI